MNERTHLCLRIGPPHTAQHRIVRMLKRQIDVFAQLRLPCNRVDKLVSKIFWIAVERANPPYWLDFAQFLQELHETRLAIEVTPILRRILRNEYNFLDPVRRELLYLIADILDRAAAVITANIGNRAESTAVVATLGDFHIGRIARRGADTRRLLIIERLILARDNHALAFQRSLYCLHNAAPRARTYDGISLGDIIEQFLLVTLTETARDNQTAAAPGLLVLGHIEHRRDGLLLGRLDKGTRIDDKDISLCWLVRNLDTMLLQNSQHNFRIDEILGTTKTDKTCFHASS